VYYAGLRRLSATRTAIVATLEPVLAAAPAYVWWDERFDIMGYAGSALILAAVLCTILGGSRGPSRQAGQAGQASQEAVS
jgi:DME family drug/metabolite transporter